LSINKDRENDQWLRNPENIPAQLEADYAVAEGVYLRAWGF
jgi:hypothetical protein